MRRIIITKNDERLMARQARARDEDVGGKWMFCRKETKEDVERYEASWERMAARLRAKFAR